MTNTQLLEWTGSFGKEYTQRNAMSLDEVDELYLKNYGVTRTDLNKSFLNRFSRSIKILEVGSNIGNQLMLLQKMGFNNLYGIEPQREAIELSKSRSVGINIIEGSAFDIPFKDRYFDLVFTSGVLIHIEPKNIKKAIKEIYRCSKRYIWGFEYYSEKYENIVYRGKGNLLWKANFPKIYMDTFSDLKLLKINFIKYKDSDNVDVMFLLKKI
jgi:pseudaminic acid biosynthesis-associated methylase